MKKIALALTASLLFSFTTYLGAQHVKPYGHIQVTEQAQPFFDRFVKLMEAHEIPVDYSQINYIDVLPLIDRAQGLYQPFSKTVFFNYYMWFPKEATLEERKELIFIVLAHEIGHSQGWEHIDAEAIGLMNPSSKFDYSIIKGSLGADQYIINTYKARLCKD